MAVNYAEIGGRIKEYRKRQKKTQEVLAQYLDVSIGYISQLERGVTKINLDTLYRLAAFFGCEVIELLYPVDPKGGEPMDAELLLAFHKLDDKQRKMVLEIVRVVGGEE